MGVSQAPPEQPPPSGRPLLRTVRPPSMLFAAALGASPFSRSAVRHGPFGSLQSLAGLQG